VRFLCAANVGWFLAGPRRHGSTAQKEPSRSCLCLAGADGTWVFVRACVASLLPPLHHTCVRARSRVCARRAVPRCVWFLFVKGKFTLRVSQSVISRSRPALPCTGSQSGSAAPVLTQVYRYFESTGKKTPGGAGTHTGHTRGHTDHTDEPHNHPNPPTHGRRSRPGRVCRGNTLDATCVEDPKLAEPHAAMRLTYKEPKLVLRSTTKCTGTCTVVLLINI
jgi:hypothetical protein